MHSAKTLVQAGERPEARKARTRRKILAAAAVLPAVLAFALILGYPIIESIRVSLSDWSGVGSIDVIGSQNYEEVVSNPAVRDSILLTIGYSLASAFGIIAIASLLAAAVSRGARGSRFYRVVWFLPSVAPVAAVSVFWANSFQPGFGAVNALLGVLGLGSDAAWLADPDLAIYPVIFVTIWAAVGFAFLMILGGMEQVDVSLYEAARVDGAGPVRQFFAITLPLIRPVLVTTTLLEVIWTANNFTVVWAMTSGGPGSATTTLPVLIYREAFTFNNFGLASATAVVSGVVLLVVGLVGLRLTQDRSES